MEYRVEELAAAADVRVDTVRFYQSRGLLPKPLRRGRKAIYLSDHLDTLRRIRRLGDQGFTLAQIGHILKRSPLPDAAEPLLEALVEEELGDRTYSGAELALETGVPESLVGAAMAAGLGQPIEIDGDPRFTESDVEMARAALAILEAGFPLDDLLALAMRHAEHVRGVSDSAIDLFDDYVRKTARSRPASNASRASSGHPNSTCETEASASEKNQESRPSDPRLRAQEEVAQAFRQLLPHVTRLVALHFQRTLVGRAIERLAESGDEGQDDLQRALAATRTGRLQVEWRS